MAEQTADLTLNCAGGASTPAGEPIPQVDITVLFNTNVASKLTAANQFTDALLIVDEPGSAVHPDRPILNCGNVGAQDNGLGPGVCSIISTGDPTLNYDGTMNGYGGSGNVCDASGGRPAANSYGCGRPNVFQARLGTPNYPGQLNAITFYNVPVDPPGGTGSRTLRITNVRVNAAAVGVSTTYTTSYVQATISVTGPLAVSISNPQQLVAYIQTGLSSDSGTCLPSAALRVRLCEGFASAWRPKNISFATGDRSGTSGNANPPTNMYPNFYWTYNGGTNYPVDVAQNVPGTIYDSETGFEWQNNTTNAPPSPNPPPGIGTTTVNTVESPLYSAAFSGLDTGISAAGVAGSGTRLAVSFAYIPAGASVQIPTILYLFNSGSNYNGSPDQYQSGATGVMVLTNTDTAGAGAFQAGSGTLTATNNVAVYEVLWADPFSMEFTEVPYALMNAPQGSQVQVTASYAPFYSDSASAQASNSYPVPRFIPRLCSAGNCIVVSPNQGTNSGPVEISLTGSPILNGAQVLLRATNQPDIPGTNLLYDSNSELLQGSFDLTGAAPGSRDVVITPQMSDPVILGGAFSILQTPSCAYSVGTQSASYAVGGGNGSLVVTATPTQCSWKASTTDSWITLLPVSPSLPAAQPYTVAANTNPSSRTGSISIQGQVVTITEAGQQTCTYSISPGSTIFGVDGGTFPVNVTAPAGCAWTAVSDSTTWLTVSGSASGSGNGSFTLQAAANTGGLRSANVTVGDKTFVASQSASACGAADVSSQVTVTRGALLLQPFKFPASYSQQVRLTNTGSAVSGPVYVVFDGVCPSVGFCPFISSYQRTQCEAAYPGSPMVLATAGGLAPGQTLNILLTFYASPYVSGVTSSTVTTRVLSGTPSQ